MTTKGPTDFNDQASVQGRQDVIDQVQHDVSALDADTTQQAPEQPQAFVNNFQNNDGSVANNEPPPPENEPHNASRGDGWPWEDLFEVDRYGKVKASVRNVELVLNNDERWRGILGYCEFSYLIVKRKDTPLDTKAGEWGDSDASFLRVWMSYQYSFTPSHVDIADALNVVARRNTFHPVREYLESLKWDGEARISKWLKKAFESTDNERYLEAVGPKVLVAAVARVMRPGCKMDNVMILEGEQGKGKSTVISILFGEFFTDAPLPIGDKDAYQVIQGKWGFEIAELDSFNKADVTALKHFFSQQIDRFRPSYGRTAQDHPRQTIFFGTTNQDSYLRDYTGNRRFWPVYCKVVKKEWVRQHRDQLWAEALHYYRQGFQWWISQETEEDERDHDVVKDAQDARLQRDPWEDVLLGYLGTVTAAYLTTYQILNEGLGFDAAHIQQIHMNRLGPIMRQLGWKSTRKRVDDGGGKKVQQRVWVRNATDEEWKEVPL